MSSLATETTAPDIRAGAAQNVGVGTRPFSYTRRLLHNSALLVGAESLVLWAPFFWAA
jgi:hypothetical protein